MDNPQAPSQAGSAEGVGHSLLCPSPGGSCLLHGGEGQKDGQNGQEEACGKGQRKHREEGKGVHKSFLELERMEQVEDLSPEPGKCSWTGE